MKKLSQLELLQHVQSQAGINIVTCGSCGDVFLHETDEKNLECPHCEAEHDPCDCPDLYYEGWDSHLNKTWEYSVSTQTLWTSFDYGEVEAKTREEALEKAIAKLNYDFKKVNEILNSCDPTIGFEVAFNSSEVVVTEKED